MIEVIWYVRLLEVISLIIAFFLVMLAYYGYKKNHSKSMLSAALGFATLGVASFIEGVLFDIFSLPMIHAHAFRSTLTAVGFFILLYSIHKTT